MSTITQFPSGNTQYRIEFDYLARTFVVVTLVNSSNPTMNRVLEVGRDYRFLNPTMIEMLVDQSGFDIVRIHRQTGTDLVVDFRNGSVLTASDLTNAELQAIHIAEEGRDQTVDLAKEYADAAGSSAGNAKDSEDEARRIAERIKASGLIGYITRRSFEKGFDVITWNEVLLCEEDGDYYRWDGTLPKNVPAGSTPETSGGIGLGAWVSVGDAALRSDLSTTVSGMGDNIVTHTQSGLTVNAEIENIKAADSEMDSRISVVESFAVSAIKTSVQNLSSVKDSDPAVQYDGFGNTVFWNGRNLFCFRRSPSHLDSVTGKHSACIAEIYKDGSAAVIWEYVPPAGIAAKEPSISVSNPGNQLIIAFTLHDVAADTYTKTIVGYADLNNSGAFTSKSDIVTTDGYYQWGNIVTTPDNKFMTSRYSVTGTEVQLITSSDVNLNGSTTWTVTKSFPISLFPGKSLINETCIGYYRGQLVAVIRSSVGSSLSGICLAKTNDATGVNGWSYLQLGFAYAGPRIEAYTDFDDPLVITGTTQRPVTPMYRSDVSMTITYDLSSFSTSQRIYQGEIFSCYASAKKTTDGSYELISFDEVPDSGVGENLVTKIHRQNFYIAQDNRTKSTVNFKENWLQSVIKETPCFGSLAGVSSTVSSSNMYFSFNTAVSGVTRLFVMIGPVESELTITPVLRRADGTTFASFYNVSVPANTRPQIIELVPTAAKLAFNIYERLNLNFSSPLPLGTVGGMTGIKLPITDRTPFGLYNVVGDTTAPYVAIAFGKL